MFDDMVQTFLPGCRKLPDYECIIVIVCVLGNIYYAFLSSIVAQDFFVLKYFKQKKQQNNIFGGKNHEKIP